MQCNGLKRLWVKPIILVKKGDELACTLANGMIRGGGDPLIDRQCCNLDTCIAGSQASKFFAQMGVGRAVVAKAQFPSFIRLSFDTFDCLVPMIKARPEYGHDNRNQWPVKAFRQIVMIMPAQPKLIFPVSADKVGGNFRIIGEGETIDRQR